MESFIDELPKADLDHALSWPPEALTGFGLAGIEQARPAHQDAFREVFAAAIAAGLHSVPHAGEVASRPWPDASEDASAHG